MIVLGIVLILIAIVASIPILQTIGLVLIILGVVLFLLGSMGRPMGGRRHYW